MKKWTIVIAIIMAIGWSLPIEAADFNGDGTNDIGIFRPDSGLWVIRGVTRAYFGSSADETVPGDYDGDGTSEIGIFRPASGLWAIQDVTRAYFGDSADVPVYAGGGGEKGPQGETGATGTQGETGATGTQGETGATGPQGETGAKGDTGDIGPQGTTGATGPQGETGAIGPKGYTGDTGSPGVKGDTGATGPQGDPGIKGDTGDTGLQGDPGIKGDTGATGPQGEPGVKGDTGDIGPAGPVAGSDGQFVYNNGGDAAGAEVYYSGGNVGIGTSAPQSKLHISGGTIRQALPKTGQTVSFLPGDDGDLKEGLAVLVDNGDGTVTDSRTGLIWPKDGTGVGYADGATKTWADAIDWAENLEFIGSTDWRLPNITELRSFQEVTWGHYQGQPVGYYWSSTTSANDETRALDLDFNSRDLNPSEKISTHYVVVVRGGE